MKKIILIICLVIVVLFGCAKPLKEKPLKKINIAFQEYVGYGLFYLAQDKGFTKDEGIELNFINEQLDSARRDTFDAGMLDCEAGTIDQLVSKRSQGTQVVLVFEIDHSFGVDGVVVTNDIKTLSDLIGKKVIFTRDDVNELFITHLLHQKGLSLKDITIINRIPEDTARAFLDKEGDAVVTWEPWLSEALKRLGSRILITSKDAPGVITDTFHVREDLVKNNPEVVKGIMRAWFKALGYYEKNPIEASEIIAKHYGISAEDYRKQASGLKWDNYKKQITEEKYREWVDAFNIISEIKFNSQRISSRQEAKQAINQTLLKELYENNK